MRSRHECYAANGEKIAFAPEFVDPEIREFWRELARLITFFDLCSPSNVDSIEIGKFFRNGAAARFRAAVQRRSCSNRCGSLATAATRLKSNRAHARMTDDPGVGFEV
jgi:hypothetical protein